MSLVNIKTADTGWILEKLARDISCLSQDVSYGRSLSSETRLQYYINYSCFNGKETEIDVAFFTHIEPDERSKKKFFDVAKHADYSVCQCEKYAGELRAAGIKNLTVIPPGIDLDFFKPKIRVGVIGRTYQTGRQGEKLLEAVSDIEGIEWVATGSGWPIPHKEIPSSEMANFYNSLDYVLVPSLYTGGPMCVLEALACGKQVIASDVGWVNDFDHIAFKNGCADSLRQVLLGLVSERYQIRKQVSNLSSQNWGLRNIKLFEELLRVKLSLSAVESKPKPVISDKKLTVNLVTHGNESTDKGGPSKRVPKICEGLQQKGVQCTMNGNLGSSYSVSHVFNIWHPRTAIDTIAKAKKNSDLIVFSPIFLDLSYDSLAREVVPNIYAKFTGKDLEANLSSIKEIIQKRPEDDMYEPFDGYFANVKQAIQMVDHVVLLSQHEKSCLSRINALEGNPYSIIKNPCILPKIFVGGIEAPAQLENYRGVFLQIGRVEPRKNQLLTAECVKRLNCKAIFVGAIADQKYAQLVKSVGGEHTSFTGFLDSSESWFWQLLNIADGFCLPSWSEGAPLAALEAAAFGKPLILSDQSSEKEYFQDAAYYVNPVDITGMLLAMEKVLSSGKNEKNNRLLDKIKCEHSIEKHVSDTLNMYESLIAKGMAESEAEKSTLSWDVRRHA